MTFNNYDKPLDVQEKRELRWYYFRLAWIIIILVAVFSGLTKLMLHASSWIITGSFSAESYDDGRKIIMSDPVMVSIYSYGFPIIADLAAILLGILITGTDIKKKFSRPELNGKEFWNTTAISFGASTAASFINMMLIFIILAASGRFSYSGMQKATDMAGISAAPNPLWLDYLVYFYICLLGPVLEEIIFRGIMLEGLRKYSNKFGIIMSSVLFGLMHQNIGQCLPAIAIGIVWAYVDIKSNSIIPSVTLHIINNTMSSILIALLGSINISSVVSDPNILLSTGKPFMIISLLFGLFRFICVIGTIIILFRFISRPHGKLISDNELIKKRTWSYLFTSIPWLAVIIYLVINTFRSVSSII